MANPPGSGDQALLQAYDDDEEGLRVVIASGASEQQTYTAPVSGEFAPGAGAAAQFPNVAGKLVYLAARLANVGNVYVGDANDTTVADGATDVTTGFELAPGDRVGPLPLANLNELWGIGQNATDSVTYLVVA